jgi:hypothetical protein
LPGCPSDHVDLRFAVVRMRSCHHNGLVGVRALNDLGTIPCNLISVKGMLRDMYVDKYLLAIILWGGRAQRSVRINRIRTSGACNTLSYADRSSACARFSFRHPRLASALQVSLPHLTANHALIVLAPRQKRCLSMALTSGSRT